MNVSIGAEPILEVNDMKTRFPLANLIALRLVEHAGATKRNN